MWLDDIKDWSKLDLYASIKRTAEDRINWRTCTQKECRPSTIQDDDDSQLCGLGLLWCYRVRVKVTIRVSEFGYSSPWL